jgi:hypothetical protein
MASALQNRRRKSKHNPRKAGPMSRKQAEKAAKRAAGKEKSAAQLSKRIARAEKAVARRGMKLIKAQASAAKKEARKAAKAAVAEYKAKHPRKKSSRKVSEKVIAARKARRALAASRRKAVSAAVRKADADCRKMVQVKVMCPPKKRAQVMKAARAAASARSNVSALQNRGRRRHARKNVSALQNRRARHNVSALQNRRARRNSGAMASVKSYAMQTLPWVIGAAGGFAAHAAAEQFGATKQIEKLALKIPTAGPYIASASHTIQGAAAAAILSAVAKAVGGKAAPYIHDTAISAIVIGVAYDAKRIMDAKQAAGKWALPTDLGDLAFGDLAFNELGALAFGDLAFGDLGFNMAGSRRPSDLVPMAGLSAYGDGMAYETAPLTADYSQASLGDAAHCGADFSAIEGQAMVNGRGHYLHRYGAPPHRMQHNPKGASHLAGRDGHRWGWLVKMVGWEKAQKIASMSPESRIKVLHKLRAAALQAFQQEMVNYEAAQIAREIPEQLTDLAPTAGGAMGAQGAGGLGDSALFMGA